MHNPVESLEEEFIIHSRDSVDVEARQSALEEKLPKENVEYGVLGGGCFVKKSHVELYMKIEKSVYKQGQFIRPYVECTVEQGNILDMILKKNPIIVQLKNSYRFNWNFFRQM